MLERATISDAESASTAIPSLDRPASKNLPGIIHACLLPDVAADYCCLFDAERSRVSRQVDLPPSSATGRLINDEEEEWHDPA
jgi:hypothetical protein